MKLDMAFARLAAAALLAMTQAACVQTPKDTAAGTRTCSDPHQSGTGVPPQACIRTSDCVGLCGSGWECWASDGNCHSHSPGTPFTAPAKKAEPPRSGY